MSKRPLTALLFAVAGAIAVALTTQLPQAPAQAPPQATLPSGRFVDLTHSFDKRTIYWPTARRFRLKEVAEGETDQGYYYAANDFSAAEHGGTHLDAPVHFARGRDTSDRIPLERFVGPAAVIDVSKAAAANRDYQVSVGDLTRWERANGTLPTDAIVLLRTGYGKFWPNRKKYMGTDERGMKAVAKLHFPGLAPAAARWLVANRRIKAIGLDTPSIDYGQSKLFLSHRILFAKNIPAFENVANLDQVPAKGALFIGLPMKIRGGSGGPLRAMAIV